MENKLNTTTSTKICENCGKDFICLAQTISECECNKINLSNTERQFLATKFKNCICVACLLEYQKFFQITEKRAAENKKGNQNKLSFIFLLCFFSFLNLNCQVFPPAAGQIGSTAIHKDSAVFVAWATTCEITRGPQNNADTSLGFVTVGESSDALGPALSNGVVSLGDGGSAICQFNFPIRNGLGFDFAVFENAIDDTFLELAFVEVSSDGNHFFRFESQSLSDTLIQTNGFGPTQAIKINNLAGKYRASYGTPFDLEELKNKNGLDVNSITHVRIVDVVGSLNASYSTYDSFLRKINDPWPTPFPSGGFDLDAIGVIHENTVVGLNKFGSETKVQIFPNPIKASQQLNMHCPGLKNWQLFSLSGKELKSGKSTSTLLTLIPEGVYTLKIESELGISYSKLVVCE